MIRLHLDRAVHKIPMERFYTLSGISRQAFYQRLTRKKQQEKLWNCILPEVIKYRKEKDTRAGSRSLFYNLDIKSKYNIGVNKFEQLMATNRQTLRPLRVRIVTTQSVFQSWQYDNLINGLKITDINQVVVGDLTYVNIERFRYYIFCLTDLYSARIVGMECSHRMRSIESKKCLDEWISLRGIKNVGGCIHHTDGGSQYFSKLYLNTIQLYGIRLSVAENCLENGYAEQQNSMIKNHFISTLKNYQGKKLKNDIERIKYFYNHERKQQRLGWLSPVEFEQKWHQNPNRPRIKLYDFEK